MDLEKITDPLYKEIGRLKMDIEWLKKNEEELSVAERRSFVDPCDAEMSVRRQCELLALSRSGYYRSLLPCRESEANEELMKAIDRQYIRMPFYGSRRMAIWLRGQGYAVNRKRVVRLMRKMGLEGQAPGPSTSKPHPEHKVYPYLLRGLEITSVNQVWSTDITYIPLRQGYMYLAAIMDWHSRYVLSWELSNSQDSEFCVRALEAALRRGKPEIFNTDQGSQFTSDDFTSRLLDREIRIGRDGRGRALDNIFIERLWRSLKYECIYLNEYENVPELLEGLRWWFGFYNEERPHTALPGRTTPRSIYEKCLVS